MQRNLCKTVAVNLKPTTFEQQKLNIKGKYTYTY